MTTEDKELEFIIYCIENTAERLGRYGSEVYNKLKELGAIDSYIRSYYDTLHTQGKAYIVDSLLEYIYYRDPQWLPEGYKPFQPTITKVKSIKGCSTFDEILDIEYGPIGTPERNNFERGADAFILAERLKEE